MKKLIAVWLLAAMVLLAVSCAGGETEKQIYRFNKGDSDLTMRFDLTVPLAKYVAKTPLKQSPAPVVSTASTL